MKKIKEQSLWSHDSYWLWGVVCFLILVGAVGIALAATGILAPLAGPLVTYSIAGAIILMGILIGIVLKLPYFSLSRQIMTKEEIHPIVISMQQPVFDVQAIMKERTRYYLKAKGNQIQAADITAYYKVLGLTMEETKDEVDIWLAYFKLARYWSPDRKNRNPALQAIDISDLAEQMCMITEAYEVLMSIMRSKKVKAHYEVLESDRMSYKTHEVNLRVVQIRGNIQRLTAETEALNRANMEMEQKVAKRQERLTQITQCDVQFEKLTCYLEKNTKDKIKYEQVLQLIKARKLMLACEIAGDFTEVAIKETSTQDDKILDELIVLFCKEATLGSGREHFSVGAQLTARERNILQQIVQLLIDMQKIPKMVLGIKSRVPAVKRVTPPTLPEDCTKFSNKLRRFFLQ